MPTMYVPPFMSKLTQATGGALVDGRQVHKQLARVVGQERHNDFLQTNGLDQPLAPLPPQDQGAIMPPDLAPPPIPIGPPMGLGGPSPLGGPISTDAPPPRPVTPPPPMPADRPPGTFGTPKPEELS